MTTTFRARFDGKVLVPEEPVDLPVGEVIECQATAIKAEPQAPPADEEETPLMRLAKIAYQFPVDPNSPRDMAAQHDHYLYGLPKKP